MWCSQNRRCHTPCSRRRSWLARRATGGIARENRALITLHRVAKSASPSGSDQTQCLWSGKTTQASMPNGRSIRVRSQP